MLGNGVAGAERGVERGRHGAQRVGHAARKGRSRHGPVRSDGEARSVQSVAWFFGFGFERIFRLVSGPRTVRGVRRTSELVPRDAEAEVPIVLQRAAATVGPSGLDHGGETDDHLPDPRVLVGDTEARGRQGSRRRSAAVRGDGHLRRAPGQRAHVHRIRPERCAATVQAVHAGRGAHRHLPDQRCARQASRDPNPKIPFPAGTLSNPS